MKYTATITPNALDWARLAAFIDGEGYIAIRVSMEVRGARPRKYTSIALNVTNTDPRLMAWLGERFGGAVYIRNREDENRNTLYAWTVFSLKAAQILRGCLEYFVIKREQAEVALRHQELCTRSRSGSTPEMFQERLSLRYKLSQLKGRGKARLSTDSLGTQESIQ